MTTLPGPQDIDPTVVVTRDLHVATVTLNRPEKKNPLGATTCGALCYWLEALKDDGSVRVVVLTGAGTAFSAGADLGGFGQPASHRTASLPQVLQAMHGLHKPLLAMVNGPALAGGFGLMLACDLAVAADTALLGTTEVNVGLWPMMIGAEMVRHLGRKRTLELMLTGRKLTAAEALEWGLVNAVVPPTELAATTRALADGLASKSPSTLRHGLSAYYAAEDLAYGDALPFLEQQLGRLLATEDAAEGILAFMQKRPPAWKGR